MARKLWTSSVKWLVVLGVLLTSVLGITVVVNPEAGRFNQIQIALAITAVAWLVIRFLRRGKREPNRWNERVEQGLCPYCGHDVRDCVDVCSECGRMIPTAVEKVIRRRKET